MRIEEGTVSRSAIPLGTWEGGSTAVKDGWKMSERQQLQRF